MYEEVQVLNSQQYSYSRKSDHYFDPFHVEEETHDADIICVTMNI